MTLLPNTLGVWAYEDSRAPLERTEPDGSMTPVLLWNVNGKILVHPDRVEKFYSTLYFIESHGGWDAVTDEVRTKFGIGPRRKSTRLDMSAEIEDAIEALVDAKKRHKAWTERFVVPLGLR